MSRRDGFHVFVVAPEQVIDFVRNALLRLRRLFLLLRDVFGRHLVNGFPEFHRLLAGNAPAHGDFAHVVHRLDLPQLGAAQFVEVHGDHGDDPGSHGEQAEADDRRQPDAGVVETGQIDSRGGQFAVEGGHQSDGENRNQDKGEGGYELIDK